eukprot:6831779-Lingulodinium_polyedra.AAC.1
MVLVIAFALAHGVLELKPPGTPCNNLGVPNCNWPTTWRLTPAELPRIGTSTKTIGCQLRPCPAGAEPFFSR